MQWNGSAIRHSNGKTYIMTTTVTEKNAFVALDNIFALTVWEKFPFMTHFIFKPKNSYIKHKWSEGHQAFRCGRVDILPSNWGDRAAMCRSRTITGSWDKSMAMVL